MIYSEIVIGPPGSGKSTYVQNKAIDLAHRNPFLINLDPGNIHTGLYDYNISTSVKEYQSVKQKGPNGSTKDILENFVLDIENFYFTVLDGKENYFLFDLPGQVEFFIAGDSLTKLVNFLTKKNINVVIVNLIDLVFFNTSLLSSYLFTYISICRMEVPFLCVISKCDKVNSYDMKFTLEEISTLKVLEVLSSEKKYEKIVLDFLNDYFMYNFQLLNYDDKNLKNLLQFNIDKCSGYCYSDEFDSKQSYIKDIKP